MDYRIRKKLRLENYDYSRNGAYFVTICTKNKMCIFWQQQKKSQPIEPNSLVVAANCVRPSNIFHPIADEHCSPLHIHKQNKIIIT